MKFDEIEAAWTKDSDIDLSNIDSECVRLSHLHAKYFPLLSRQMGSLQALNIRLKALKRDKREYYLGETPIEVLSEKGLPAFAKKIVKSEVDLYVDSDPEVQTLLEQIAVHQVRVTFLELIVKSLNNRGYLLKTALDFQKFKNGLLT
jgi:hypothetical protein